MICENKNNHQAIDDHGNLIIGAIQANGIRRINIKTGPAILSGREVIVEILDVNNTHMAVAFSKEKAKALVALLNIAIIEG